MKSRLPYSILLGIALAATGLMVYLNLVLQGSHAITVTYNLPAVVQNTGESRQVMPQDQRLYAEEEATEPEEPAYYYHGALEEDGGLISVSFPLDLNTATEEQLRFIPQVGPVMSQRIVQYREHLGGYTSLEQLRDIQGVGNKTYERLSAYLYVDGEGEDADTEASGINTDVHDANRP